LGKRLLIRKMMQCNLKSKSLAHRKCDFYVRDQFTWALESWKQLLTQIGCQDIIIKAATTNFTEYCFFHSVYRFLHYSVVEQSMFWLNKVFLKRTHEQMAHLRYTPWVPSRPRFWHANLWSSITPERIGLDCQCKHSWMRETEHYLMNLTKICLYFWRFWEKSIFLHSP